MAEGQEAILGAGVVGVGEGDGQRVAEDGRRLGKRDSVLGEVADRLVRISLEVHPVIVSLSNSLSK